MSSSTAIDLINNVDIEEAMSKYDAVGLVCEASSGSDLTISDKSYEKNRSELIGLRST